MKKNLGFLVSAAVLASALVLSLSSCANPMSGLVDSTDARSLTITKTLSHAPDVYTYVLDGYNSSVGPISITKGVLTANGRNTPIYLVTLSGTQFKSNQATGIINDLQAAMSIEGAYVTAIRNAILSYVPQNSNLILAGHSLGGMVAQQIAADSTIKNKYVVMNTVCFGSPLITFIIREGAVQRLGDTSDIVPTLSISSLFLITGAWNIFGLNRENGGYGLNLLGAHLRSYERPDVWGSYSALGFKNQSASIGLYTSTRKWFAAPAGMAWKN